ncbi:hypothetical protein B0H16DRAFT_1746467 [Mycena metata]|uniref:Uncharacterized protein n=1 Tax=Mycena metata TaxID=1033252 RepID=A0AAD7MA80_9AGAR|nr:hypothetical protein B0H16DRAFT_1746467 [Mycena metata]
MSFRFVSYQAEPGSQPLSGGNVYENNLKWSQYTPEEAAGKNSALRQRTFASSITLDHLKVSAEQLHEIYRWDATAVDGPVDFSRTKVASQFAMWRHSVTGPAFL